VPDARAAFRWILLSALLGMSCFVVTIMFPVLLGLPTQVSQGFALSAYAVTYAGVSLGILKLRLFDLERWWFRVWSWVLGGALMVLADLALVSLFDLDTRESLMITLAVCGWLYFPVRQWLLRRLTQREPGNPLGLGELLAARTPDALEERMDHALRTLFGPLRVERLAAPLQGARLDPTGTRLSVPAPTSGHFVCHFRNRGRDLFRPRDLEQAKQLAALARSVSLGQSAYREGQEEERARIRRDLHDDMGASIIRIIHATKDREVTTLAKRTMRDLRNVLLALAPDSASIKDVLEDLRAELTAGVPAARVRWQVDGEASWALSGRQRANFVRTLREASTNALRHGDGDVEYRFLLSDQSIEVEVTNSAAAPATTAGLGMRNIAARIEEIGGDFSARHEDGVFSFSLRLPRTREP
jgi:signal transduction histidine kinase